MWVLWTSAAGGPRWLVALRAIGRLFSCLYHGSRSVTFSEAVCSRETADQETSNCAKMFTNSRALGREGAGDYCLL